MFQNPRVEAASKVQEERALFSSLNSSFLYGFLVHTVGKISPEVPGSRDFPEGYWGLLVLIPHAEGGL